MFMENYTKDRSFYPTGLIPPDFIFYIDGKKYPVHRVVVGSLCERLNRDFQKDPNFSSFTFHSLKDPNNYFELISNMFFGDKLTINKQNAPFLNEIASILECEPLKQKTREFIDQPTPENAIEVMKIYGESNIDNPECAEILASDFDTYCQKPEFLKLPVYAFEQIFSVESFKISEDKLFDFIEKLIQENSKSYSSLLSLIHTEKIDQERAKKFVEYVSYDNVSVWIIKEMLYRINPEPGISGPSN